MGVAAAENGSGEALDELEGSDDEEEEEDGEGEGEDDGDSSADSEAGEWVTVGSDMPSQVRVQAGAVACRVQRCSRHTNTLGHAYAQASSEEEESEEEPAPKKRKQQVQQKASGAKKQKVCAVALPYWYCCYRLNNVRLPAGCVKPTEAIGQEERERAKMRNN
jgi:hypothetical protein